MEKSDRESRCVPPRPAPAPAPTQRGLDWRGVELEGSFFFVDQGDGDKKKKNHRPLGSTELDYSESQRSQPAGPSEGKGGKVQQHHN